MRWGRQTGETSGTTATPRRRFGLTSILLALAALVLVVACVAYLINLPSGSSESRETVAIYALVFVYFIVAPTLHIAGIVYGIRGVASPSGGKVSGAIGILLNAVLLVAGFLFGLGAMSSIGAYT
jgi:hypothetical protein